ncbi:shikimate kinase [Prolixibacteraceae bacterium JC049]|nr:shikimate kinase [Prolixibacteraceae bacterium JC049]
MTIFLIGFMGSGKSTLGRRLAALTGCSFIDMDKFIEEKYFKTVAQIFAEEGEASFREKERLAIEELAGFQDVVIGTGGGAPCFGDNMNQMNQSGITVWLDVPVKALVARLSRAKAERPLIKEKNTEELTLFVEEKLNERNVFYSQAKVRVTGGNIQAEDITTILEASGS